MKEILLFENLHTLKNKKRPLRNIPIGIERERPFVDVLLSYINLSEFGETSILFDISRQRAWSIIKKMSGQRTHFLRHCRLSDLFSNYDLDSELIQRFAGWTDNRPAKTYLHLSWQDAARKMI